MEHLIQQAVQLYEDASAALERGDFARSDALHLECIALFQQARGPNSLDAASVFTALADLRQKMGDLAGALNAATEADSILAVLIGDENYGSDLHSVRIQAYVQTGSIHRQRAEYVQSEAWLHRALDLATRHFGEESEPASDARNELGMLYKYTAQFDKAETLYGAALAHLQSRFGEQHSSVAALYHNLGGLEHARGRFARVAIDFLGLNFFLAFPPGHIYFCGNSERKAIGYGRNI